MKALYLSSMHPTAERDDLTIFSDLGIDWCSNGIYFDPPNPRFLNLRPGLNKNQDKNFSELFSRENLGFENHFRSTAKLTREIVEQFDLVFISNKPEYLVEFWPLLKDKKVVYRSYDGHSPIYEPLLNKLAAEGLTIVRMFEWENDIPFAAKTDKIISSFVDEKDYYGWEGTSQLILTFQNDYLIRSTATDTFGIQIYPNYSLYQDVIRGFRYRLIGLNNGVAYSENPLSWEDQKKTYRKSRLYFSLGSKPSWYTYNLMEAMMTGCPTINFGRNLGSYNHPWYPNTYKLPDLIENGVNGFCSDNINELREFAGQVLNNMSYALSVSKESRAFALKYFSKDKALRAWKEVLMS